VLPSKITEDKEWDPYNKVFEVREEALSPNCNLMWENPISKTRVYSDTMFSDKKSMHGMTCAQVFVMTEGFVKVYLMKNKAEAYDTLNNFYVTVGFPLKIITDNTKEDNEVNQDLVIKYTYYKNRQLSHIHPFRIRQGSKSGN